MAFHSRSGHPLLVLVLIVCFTVAVYSEVEDLSKLLKKYAERVEGISEKRLNTVKNIGERSGQNHHRSKRELPETLTTISEDLSVLVNVTALDNNLQITLPTHLASFCANNGVFYIVVAGTDGSSLVTKVFRHNEDAGSYDEVQSISTPTLTDMVTFTMVDGDSYLILTEITDCRFVSTCTAIYIFDTDAEEFESIQEIASAGAIALETFELDDVWCLVVINSRARVNSTDEGVVYEWRGYYFDEICDFPVNQFIVDVCSFTIHNLKFIALASNVVYFRRVSEIMVYSPIVEDFVNFQYIYVEGAIDFEFFTFGKAIEQEFFLALAVNRLMLSNEKSIIYKYHKGRFEIFQYVEANQAERWHTITSPDGRFQLLVLSSSTAARFFFYDGWCFRETTYQPFWDTIPAGVRDFSSHTINDTVYLSIARFQVNLDDTNIYMLEFERENPVQELHDRAMAAITVARQLVNDSDALIAKVESQLENLVTLDSPEEQVIASFKVFDAEVNEITFLNAAILHGESGSIFSGDEEIIVAELFENTTRRWSIIGEILDLLPTFVRKSGENQFVTGEKNFEAISAMSVVSSSVTVESDLLNEHINLTELDQDIVQTDQTLTIEVPLTILGDLNVNGSLDIDGLIDGIDLDNLVLNNNDKIIHATKTFQNGINIQGDVWSSGTVDGVAISNDTILLLDGDQHYRGHLIIDGNVLFNDDVHVDALNGIDLYELQEYAVYKALMNETCNFTGYKEFFGDATAEDFVSVWGDHMIGGVNVREFEEKTMQPDIEYNITGLLIVFGDVTVEGNLYVNGTVDGVNIPDEVVFLNSSETQVLHGKLNFSSDVDIDSMHVLKSIDGIRSDLGEDGDDLDILLTTGGQTVIGHLEFEKDVHVLGNVTVHNTLGGVRVEFLDEVVTKDEEQTILCRKHCEKTFNNTVTIEGNLTVGLINDIDIVKLNELALRADDDIIATMGGIVFSGPVEILGDLITNGLHSFNNKTLSELVLLYENRTINGEKTFTNITSTDDVILDGLINGIDLSEVYENAVMMNASGTVRIDGNINFMDSVYVEGDIIAPPVINDILLSDVVTMTGSHNITSNVTFLADQTIVELVISGDLWVDGLVDGVAIEDLDENTLKIYGDQFVTATQHFTQNLTVLGNLSVYGLIDNVDIEEFADDAVYTTGSYNISGEKTFLDNVHINSIWLSGLLDGVDLRKLKQSAMIQAKRQVVSVPNVRFTENVTITHNLAIGGLINGLDLDYLDAVALKITDTTIPVEIDFEHLHIASCDVIVSGLVDGIDLSEDAIQIDKNDQVINGQKLFDQSVVIEGDIIGIYVINGINLTELYNTTVMFDSNQVITGLKHILGDMFVDGNMTVGGYFNGYKIDYLNDYILQSDDELVVFTSNVTVETLEANDDVEIENGLLCGLNLTEIRLSYLSKTLSQTISASIHFKDLEVTDQQFLSNNITALDYDSVIGHYINDVNLAFMLILTSVGRDFQMINGTVAFMRGLGSVDITVLGDINGMQIPEETMLISADNNVTAAKTFADPVDINDDLLMSTFITINGIDISEWAATVTYTDDDVTLPVTVHFDEDLVFLRNLSVTGLLDGVDLSATGVLLTHTSQTISANITFTDLAFMYIDLDGDINGWDVDGLYNNTLYDNGLQYLSGEDYDGNPTFYNITLSGLIDDVDLLNLLENLEHMVHFGAFNDSLQERCEAIDELHDAQENHAVLMGCTEVLSTFSTTGTVSWHSAVYNETQFLLMGTTGNGTSVCNPMIMYLWNETTEEYNVSLELYPSRADDVSSFMFENDVFIVIASQGEYLEECSAPDFPDISLSINFANSSGSVSVLYPFDVSTAYHYQKINIDNPGDVEVFDNPLTGDVCMTVVEAAKITNSGYTTNTVATVFCLSDLEIGFVEVTTIPTMGAVKINHFLAEGKLNLAIANFLDSSTLSVSTYSEVWIQTDNYTFVEAAEVSTSAAMDILAMEINGYHYVVVANGFDGTLTDLVFDVPVQIYEYAVGSSLQWVQDLTSFGPLHIDSYSFSSNHLLFVVDRTDTVTVYKYQGAVLMFVRAKILPVHGAQTIHVFPVYNTDLVHGAVGAYAVEDRFFPEQQVSPIEIDSYILQSSFLKTDVETESCS